MASEGALLVVAAQAGFVDGPRVMANMAIDSWMPRRFAVLSERLTIRNGILLMGAASLTALLATGGDVRFIVVMYALNVFLTFSMTEISMCRFWIRERHRRPEWVRQIAVQLAALSVCGTILVLTLREKFLEGGWITLAVTGAVIVFCFLIRAHYRTLSSKITTLYGSLLDLKPVAQTPPPPVDPQQPTAAILVQGYNGLGVHTTLAAFRTFPDQFKNVLFISVGVVDSGAFKGEGTLEALRGEVDGELAHYVDLIRGQGIPATAQSAIGTDVVLELEKLCLTAASGYPNIMFFAGQLVFQSERWYHPILHNETTSAIQRRLQAVGKTMVVLPTRIR